jgi:signal transduction histidine kinase
LLTDETAEQSLEHALISVAEREQERLGRELHDGIGQELAGAAFLAKALATKLQGTDPQIAADAEWIKTILGRCVESVRNLSRRLSPSDLAEGNAIAALERLCADVERSYGIPCALLVRDRVRSACERESTEDSRQRYRICQEALNNATRHSGCRSIFVQISLRAGMLRMAISDNGDGFQPDDEAGQIPSQGMGLNSMVLRARSLGGTLRVVRRSGWTHVILKAPLGTGTTRVIDNPRFTRAGLQP